MISRLILEYRRRLLESHFGVDKDRVTAFREEDRGEDRGTFNVMVDTYAWVEYFRGAKRGERVKGLLTICGECLMLPQ